ncbi:YdcF family protein [Marinisporobacter balticus]|uniref:Uncharacterized SAM-binding protein YcdF (DUF218 family) n=1 Tax=Marinisporobacter balticus TaxID=2018667 RepID=A0A4R2KC30_9FIRM|nr:YdcF family protein [Marinisporobacter balticus]TCO71033.1 uncharacterized SAM-binding protein YcdF (DUF218 family) [Marinisporobacter balticus]
MKKQIEKLIKSKMVKTIFYIWFLSFFMIEGLIIFNGNLEHNQETEYVVVLGAGLKGERLSLTLLDRMSKCLEYMNDHPDVKVVVSGGQGRGEDIAEAEAMKRFLIKRGIRENRVVKEDQSTSTLENIKFTKEKLKKIEKREIHEIIIITNRFHLFRAKLLAKRNGIVAYGVPSKTRVYLMPKYYFREYFAVIKSVILDR